MNKKQLILTNALKLFAKEGYEGVGVMKIVTESQVTKPTLYHHFGSKEGLLQDIYETYFGDFLRDIKAKLDLGDQLMTSIEESIVSYIRFASLNQDFFILSNHLRRGPSASKSKMIVNKYHQEELALVKALMMQISKVHINLKGKEELLAINFLNMINGYIEYKINNHELDDVDEQDITYLTKQFLYGIFSL